MTDQQHTRALEIKERLKHIDELIDFLAMLTETKPVDPKGFLQELGFTPHPEKFTILQADIDCLREALGQEKMRLNTEFNML